MTTFDPVVNFGIVTVSTGYVSGATSISLQSGEGSKLPDPAVSGDFNLTWWDNTNYQTADIDPNKEIVRCTGNSGDILTVIRAQEGTADTNKNTGGSTYKMGLTFTKKTYENITDAFLNIYIDELVDVNASSPTKNDVLKWNGLAFVPAVYNASFTFSIATFTCTIGATATVFEIGSGTWKAIGELSFSATYNNGPATDGYVSHSGWSNLTMDGVGYVGPTLNTETVSYPSVGSTKAFTLHATDGTDTSTNTITYYFYNRRFWGVSSVASGYTEADIEGLANNELSNSKTKTFTVSPGSGEYIIFSYPKRLGTVTFYVGGFEGGLQAPETVSVTNASGYTEDYYIYRSTNSNLGSTTVTTV